MGYTTDFTGALQLSRQLTEKEKNYINLMSSTRRMKRDVNKLMALYHGEHGNPFATEKTPEAIYGFEGQYFAKDDGDYGQKGDISVIDNNSPAGQLSWGDPEWKDKSFAERYAENERRKAEGLGQPGLWCQWVIDEDNQLVWDGGEKFYNYVEWLQYYITHFFEPWGVKLNGSFFWEGEESGDLGKITVTDNVMDVKEGHIEYR